MAATVIICEDELTQLQQLESIVKDYSIFHKENFNLGISTQNPYDVLDFVDEFSINGGIYFLDIDLKSTMNGIDLAKKLTVADPNSRLIFVTTHDEMAITAMQVEVRAFNFILKDIDLNIFMDSIRKVMVAAKNDIDISLKNKKSSFSFSIANKTININFEDLLYIKTSEIPHQVELYTDTNKYSFYAKLNELENKYSKLFRVNRSFLINPINLYNIDYSKHLVYFKNYEPIKLSFRKSTKLKSKMNKLNTES